MARVTALVTLTYRGGVQANEQHVHDMGRHVRSLVPDAVLSAVLHQTQKGTRYYVARILLPNGERLPLFDKAGWWPHGATQTQRLRHRG